MEKLNTSLINKIKKLITEQDSRFKVIDSEERNGYWIAIVVEDYDCQYDLKNVLYDMIDGKYEAEVKTGDYIDFSGEKYEDLNTECLNWQVVYVLSSDFWRKKQLYGC